MENSLEEKYRNLQELLAPLPGAALAFSGGVDSTLLLYASVQTLGPEKVTLLTAVSPLLPRKELESARELALSLGAKVHLVVDTPDITGPNFQNNPRERCYHCKKEIFSCFLKVLQSRLSIDGKREKAPPLIEGTNREDLKAYRPGRQAVLELGVRSPLVEARLEKKEIRLLARHLGLPNWDLPSQACLASRIPYGEPLEKEKLMQVEKGEHILKDMGFKECRLRHHGTLARLEVPCSDLHRLLSLKKEVVEKIKALGFTFVSLDLSGLRSGSFD